MINTNALKYYSVYSSFLSFVTSFQHVKSLKYTKLLWIMFLIHAHPNHYILEPLWLNQYWKIDTNALKYYFVYSRFYYLYLILKQKIIKIYEVILNDVSYSIIIAFSNLYNINSIERCTNTLKWYFAYSSFISCQCIKSLKFTK
jgi:hypothetical protein